MSAGFAHVALQETVIPDVSWQHCAGCPSDAVHCDESLHDWYVLGGLHACAGAWHVEAPRIAAQHPSPTGHRVEPHATVMRTEDESELPTAESVGELESGTGGTEASPLLESAPESAGTGALASVTPRVPSCRSFQPETSEQPAHAESANGSARRATTVVTPKDLTDRGIVNPPGCSPADERVSLAPTGPRPRRSCRCLATRRAG